MTNRFRVIVVGGGASGLMAALTAAETGGLQGPDDVLILEKNDRIGKKLLMTGNGRCNLTNLSFSASARDDIYRTDDRRKIEEIFASFSVQDTCDWFKEQGLFLTTRMESYVYPRALQASAVTELFEARIRSAGITVHTQAEVQNIEVLGDGTFKVYTKEGIYFAEQVILSCGSTAGLKEDPDSFCRLAVRLGHERLAPLPSLTGLRCRENAAMEWAGVRCDGEVRIIVDGSRKNPMPERGEVQLTDYGISGIPVFQISVYAAKALKERKKVYAEVDFLPEYDIGELQRLLTDRMEAMPAASMQELLGGMVNSKLLKALFVKLKCKPSDRPGTAQTAKILERAIEQLKAWRMEVIGTNSITQAQVCAGGVPLYECTEQLESIYHPGLYLCGEMVNVDARCGGYNLQWAWSSGHMAGCAAAGRYRK